MSRNWLRHHVDTQDGQAVIRKTVVTSSSDRAATMTDTPGDNVKMSPQQARYMVERARRMRAARERVIAANNKFR